MIRTLLRRLTFGHQPTWWERYFLLIVVGAAVVFMAISLVIGLYQNVWFDEAYSIMLAKQPAGQLVHLTALDTHPPLYYLLLRAWGTLFGWGEFALRSLSVLAAGGAVVMAGLLVRRTFGVRIAIVALSFVTFAPLLLRYGFEIRMYAIASLVGIAATYVMVRAIQTKPGRDQWLLYGAYAVLVAIGMYTLYYMALLWIAHAVWLVWLARRQKQPIVTSGWMKAFGLSIVLFIPWLPAFVSQIGNGALASISQPLTIDNLVGIVSFGFVYQPSWQLGALMSLVVLFVITAIGYFAVKAYRIVPSGQRPYLMLLAMYMAVPIVVLTLVSLARPVYVERYLAHIAIGGMLFVGVVVGLNLAKATKKTRLMAATLAAVLLIGTVHLARVGNFNFQRLQSPMIKQAAATMDDCRQGTTVFAADPYVAIELAYYLPSCQINFYSETVLLRGGYAPLSNSPLHIDDPARELALSRKIHYVYYDQQKSMMPPHLKQTSVVSYDSLYVATFSME